MYKILGQELADSLGFATVGASVGMTILEWFTALNVNEVIHTIASVGGLAFLFYKIKHLRFELKVKKEEYKRLKKKNEKSTIK